MTGGPPARTPGTRAAEFRARPSRPDLARRILGARLRYWQLGGVADAAGRAVTDLLARAYGDDAGAGDGAEGSCSVAVVVERGRLALSVTCDGTGAAAERRETGRRGPPDRAREAREARETGGAADGAARTLRCALPLDDLAAIPAAAAPPGLVAATVSATGVLAAAGTARPAPAGDAGRAAGGASGHAVSPSLPG